MKAAIERAAWPMPPERTGAEARMAATQARPISCFEQNASPARRPAR